MRYLSLAALKVGLADLFDNRLAALVLSSAGKTYEAILLEKKALIDALPAVLTGGRPLAEEITATDADYDGYGGAIWHLAEAYERCPNVPPEVRAILRNARNTFIPRLEDLKASYVDEANTSIGHKSDLQKQAPDLKLIPIAGGLTLVDWVEGKIASGTKLSSQLSQRADTDTGARSQAGKIRTSTVGVLGRFRGALGDELAVNKALPADLDAQVFGYFDELDKMRADALAAAKKPTPPPATPPAAPPATPPA